MADFAKLFVAEGIGQILITTGTNDEGYPCLTCRIPDTDDMILNSSIVPKTENNDEAFEIVARLFEETTLASALKIAQTLIELRDDLTAYDFGGDAA